MKRPYFIWDYDLTDQGVKAILKSNNELEKTWMIGRILSSARYDDVWKYLTVDQIVKFFPKLRIRKEIKAVWKNALTVWGYNV